eukprot:CAMPEP_0169166824 /NCGR_PEP_ID=MMETSP1015-20121227/60137_1 /TAXON_ID=342587 /ORGANISM="Karlodinium micrum, Strain CCMP2283" /LENGTH=180 /DNA_ID=CAMNT_0009239479 /DNA_START=48 /DNA_END=591 /DNA_ORIENTATION=-
MAVAFRPPARRITVRCKIAGGAQFELDVDPGTTVGSMKRTLGRKLAERGCEVCSEHVRLIVKGKFLGDDSIVRECQVVPGCKMLLMRDAILPSDSSGSEAAATASLDVVREYEVTPEELDLQAQQEPVCLQEDTSIAGHAQSTLASQASLVAVATLSARSTVTRSVMIASSIIRSSTVKI